MIIKIIFYIQKLNIKIKFKIINKFFNYKNLYQFNQVNNLDMLNKHNQNYYDLF